MLVGLSIASLSAIFYCLWVRPRAYPIVDLLRCFTRPWCDGSMPPDRMPLAEMAPDIMTLCYNKGHYGASVKMTQSLIS